MMEVTPHLKSVLKNYQYSATKSLQGPGLSLNPPTIKNELPSPEGAKEEEFPNPAPFPVQQVPILVAPDTSCSERSETILEGEAISCFVVGGEKRLCLPQVLNSVLRDFSLQEINRECDHLQIYCSRCTPEQLNVLKSHGILPSGAPSCGLITKTDAERLCSALLFAGLKNLPFRPRKGITSFPIYHECFGEARGRCYPDLYTSKHAKCIECSDCQGGFSPQQFVCHVHRNLENRTVHWGFDSSSHWRAYLHLPDEQSDQEALEKILDELKDRYEGKVPFPPPLVIESTVKRKQIAASDLVKDHQAAVTAASELPLKKQKLDEYLQGTLARVPTFPLPAAAAAIMQQQLYSALEPVYIHRCLQEYNNVRGHLSAFKPVVQSIREQKLRSANALGLAARCAADPPLLQNPERVVMMSESERFERTYQPNVALAPPTPKKHRYGRAHETATSPQQCSSSTLEKGELLSPLKAEPPPQSPLMNGHHIKDETESAKSPPCSTSPEKIIDSTVSVLQTNNSILIQPPKYNPEIELSTDTEDSASETSEKTNSDYAKLEEVLKSVNNDDVREKVLGLFRNLSKERERAVLETRTKDQDRMSELEGKNAELERGNSELRRELEDLRRQSENNNKPARENIIKDTNSDLVTSSSIIVQAATEDKAVAPAVPCVLQKSVIASVASVANSVANGIPNSVANNLEAQSEVIKNTAPE